MPANDHIMMLLLLTEGLSYYYYYYYYYYDKSYVRTAEKATKTSMITAVIYAQLNICEIEKNSGLNCLKLFSSLNIFQASISQLLKLFI